MTPQPMRLRKKRSRTGMYASWQNGVSYMDASEVILQVRSWHAWCRLWMERAAVREREAREMEKAGRIMSAAEAYVRASLALSLRPVRLP